MHGVGNTIQIKMDLVLKATATRDSSRNLYLLGGPTRTALTTGVTPLEGLLYCTTHLTNKRLTTTTILGKDG